MINKVGNRSDKLDNYCLLGMLATAFLLLILLVSNLFYVL